MKNIKNHLDESLIKSYDTNKLINKIKNRYKDTEVLLIPSKSNESLFKIIFNNEEDFNKFKTDIYIQRQLDFFGYYITEQIDKDLIVFIEPNFGTKCTKFVYDNCNGLIFHVTSKERYDLFIKDIGIKPLEGSYRKFTERSFFVCGETKKEIIENIEYIMDQLKKINPIILMIDLKKKHYNVDFYYDPSEDNWHNCIYCNAWFPITYITEVRKLSDLTVNIDENLQVADAPWSQT